MTDPMRLRDPASEASDQVRELLRAGKRAPKLDPGAHARVSEHVQRLALHSVLHGASTSWSWGTVTMAGLGIALCAVVLVATVGRRRDEHAAAYVSRSARVVSPPTTQATQAIPTQNAAVPPAPLVPVPDPTRPAPTTSTPPARISVPTQGESHPRAAVTTPNPAPTRRAVSALAPADQERGAATPPPSNGAAEDALTREQAILDPAFELLASDPSATLERVQAHERAFPDGRLTPEREFLRVEALSRLGRTDEARESGEAFLRRFATGIYAERVRRTIGGTH